MRKSIEEIARQDGRYGPQVVQFVYDGLGYTAKKGATEPGHIRGQDLARGLAELAVEKWGRLAVLVLDSAGAKTTRDFGEIVYMLIENKWMSAQPTDSIDDFNDVYDFKTVLKDDFKF